MYFEAELPFNWEILIKYKRWAIIRRNSPYHHRGVNYYHIIGDPTHDGTCIFFCGKTGVICKMCQLEMPLNINDYLKKAYKFIWGKNAS